MRIQLLFAGEKLEKLLFVYFIVLGVRLLRSNRGRSQYFITTGNFIECPHLN